MAGAKEVRTKIASVKSTQKITKAMELVAASKMKKAQDNMLRSKPYATKILQVITHLTTANLDFEHAYLTEQDGENVGVLVVSSDRGLCGGLNVNLFKKVNVYAKEIADRGGKAKFSVVGSKAHAFFKNVGGDVVAYTNGLGDHPSMESLLGNVKVLLDLYLAGEVSKVVVIYNKFVNTMTQAPTVEQILPITKETFAAEEKKQGYSWDYIYEPAPEALLEHLVSRFIESRAYQALVENIACEQAARMVAMKSATDNAGDMIKELQLVYNKARQASITQELAEIVGGASAV
ncbi:MAG TPA: F0F1 ATP synthase subunit gamma [Gammaproteobacteria bacterium]|nr:F0F1 ATP synthase subunit gamma [Gammaproteobacteria bacterium]HCK91548.1 F0F1 ATP synthase subunit gamma [Gammaproteobacteria bacterium]|tara:strand:- start:6401 stop:7273 length:873 start_codon:yes stop_codon:yes gene_type:complete